MAMFFQSSTNSLKLFLISTTVLSAAIILKLSAPAVTDFAVSEVPSIWNGVVSWLKPPYLYLVINCIIITIVASSKLQSKFEDHSSHAPAAVVPPEKAADFYPPVMNGVVLKTPAAEAAAVYNEYPAVMAGPVYDVAKVEKVLQVNPFDHVEKDTTSSFFNVNAFSTYPEVNEVVRKPSPAPVMRQDSIDYNNLVSGYSAEKPPASARFSHRKNVKSTKSTPEGGKASLRVTKPKRQDTLESTWKTITEGRAMPLTRHLRKSDTWETHGGRNPLLTPPQQKMKKSETFQDRGTASSPLTPSPGSGKLKKEPSLSQDELNKRVEAFINKFNEEMRLQRQQSLQQYMDMINRGAH